MTVGNDKTRRQISFDVDLLLALEAEAERVHLTLSQLVGQYVRMGQGLQTQDERLNLLLQKIETIMVLLQQGVHHGETPVSTVTSPVPMASFADLYGSALSAPLEPSPALPVPDKPKRRWPFWQEKTC